MKHFVIRATDKLGALQVRLDNRDDHVAYLKSHSDQIIAAGPILSETDEAMIGSVLIMAFENRGAAQKFCSNDPYQKAGLFDNVDITLWKKVFPAD